MKLERKLIAVDPNCDEGSGLGFGLLLPVEVVFEPLPLSSKRSASLELGGTSSSSQHLGTYAKASAAK